jgi:hypothetical protein
VNVGINALCWLFWIIGSILILLSWVHVVTAEIGWLGFGMAGAAALIARAAGWFPQRSAGETFEPGERADAVDED